MIYSIFGFGKGKSESAIGITVRAIENGDKVLYSQFLKDGTSNEIKFFKRYKLIDLVYRDVKKITLPQNVKPLDQCMAQEVFANCYTSVDNKLHKLIVADELIPALDMGLVTHEQVALLVSKCRENGIDLYLTGRARQSSIRKFIEELSDVCSNVYCVKHSFNTFCSECGNDYKYHYTYCPDCGSVLKTSVPAKEGRDH